MKLRSYQEEGLQALWQYFVHHKGNPVISWPTGTGKSLLPAEFIKRTLMNFPNERFLVVTHVKELIQQNFEKLMQIYPEAPAGINSAGLKRRDIHAQIIYGGIQSMHRNPDYFGHRDIMFIDEAHLVSQDDASMYLGFIAALRAINPYLRIIGMSATPYRIGQGMITEGGLFTHIAHDLTSLDNFNQLVRDGFLSPLIPKKTSVELDISNVGIQKGEFIASQLQHEIDKVEITSKALQEAFYYGQNRRSWLIFATGIEHAEHIAAMLQQNGISCAAVHSKQASEYNDAAIKAFKNYELRAIANYGKLTTGFDHPGIDMIVMLRPTLSVALWVQMLGRGTRVISTPQYLLADNAEQRLAAIAASTKQNCLVLDFAKNTPRLGPINDPVIPRKKGDKGGEIPIKICEACGIYNHIKAVTCCQCGATFEFKVKIVERAGTDELLRQTEAPIIEMFDVTYAIYNKKQKDGKPPYLQATYFSGLNGYSEYVFFEHKGLAKHKAHEWWRQRNINEPPATVDEVLHYKGQLRIPKRIRVHTNKMYNGRKSPEILSVEFGE